MPFIKCIIVEIENTVIVTRARGVEGTRRNIKYCGIHWVAVILQNYTIYQRHIYTNGCMNDEIQIYQFLKFCITYARC